MDKGEKIAGWRSPFNEHIAKMLGTAEVLRLMLWTLALGVTIPVLLQLFLLLRQLRKTVARVSVDIEPTLRLFHEIAQRPRETAEGSSQLASIVATIIPAAIAAYRAYRQHHTEETSESGSLTEADASCKDVPDRSYAATK